ncbi:MAG TPA: hypothetical protein VIM42_06375 [Clostridium sp.]
MKKNMYLLSVGVIVSLIGCGTAPVVNTPAPTVSVADQAKAKQVEDGQKAIIDLKAKATKADFIEINGHYDQVKAKPVFFEGKVSTVVNTYDAGIPNFLITQGGEMFYIINGTQTLDLKNGDTVKIYGNVSNPKEGLGMPTIMCSVIEKK